MKTYYQKFQELEKACEGYREAELVLMSAKQNACQTLVEKGIDPDYAWSENHPDWDEHAYHSVWCCVEATGDKKLEEFFHKLGF
jgi:hypothetical protein